MKQTKSLQDQALEFVNLLTPGNFDKANDWISGHCEYKYGETVLKGEAIINSFIQNHEQALKKLDSITYLDGSVERVDGNEVSVLVKDQIMANGQTHTYTDRLIITLDNSADRPVIKIENKRVDGEREKLLKFFESCGIDW